MILKDLFIKRFGMKMFGASTGPSFIPSSLRFELGVGKDSLSYKITAMQRLNCLLDDLGFKALQIGVAAYAYTYDADEFSPPIPLHQQLLPFARGINTWGGIKFCRSEFTQINKDFDPHLPDEESRVAIHFGMVEIDYGLFSSWLILHLMGDFGASAVPQLMLFDLDSGIMINPYDVRGMDVFGPNHDLLAKLYRKRNDWLLDFDRDRMRAVYG